MMKLVDEKKALTEISNLRKQRKGFAGFDDAQKQIDEKKAKLKKLRDSLEDPESKALSERYNTLQAELDTIKAEQDDVFKNLNSLRDEKTRLQNEQNQKWAAIKEIKDKHYQAGRALQKWEFEARQRARERKKAENEKYHQEKKKERAQQMLAEASDPAYLDEIRKAESLLVYLDPSYVSEKAPLQAPSQFQATAQRTVDDSGIKGIKVVKKEEEDYFAGTGGKKGKKNRKENKKPEEAAAPKVWSCPPAVSETCIALGIDPPYSAAEAAQCKEKVTEKLAFWKQDQAAQTEKVSLLTLQR
jgi:DNA repair exonuclease SbcCD ATPase subunit